METVRIDIPEAIIGRRGKKLKDLVLQFDAVKIELYDKEEPVFEPVPWVDITGSNEKPLLT
jgi:hypothetical protein